MTTNTIRSLTSKATLFTIVIVLLSVAVLQAQNAQKVEAPAIKSQQAVAAIKAYEAAEAKAKADYEKAVATARTAAIKSLETAMAAATKAGNLEEAVAIKEKIAALKAEDAVQQARDQNRLITVTVQANQRWTKVGEVKKGQVLEITAPGNWAGCIPSVEHDADGITGQIKDNFQMGALTGKVGDKGKVFLVGKSSTYTVESDGILFLGPNDSKVEDNIGELQVTVMLKGIRR